LDDGYADVTGSVVARYITYFEGPTTISGNANLQYDADAQRLNTVEIGMSKNAVNGYVLTCSTEDEGIAQWQDPMEINLHRIVVDSENGQVVVAEDETNDDWNVVWCDADELI
jgi:hypothetical protein